MVDGINFGDNSGRKLSKDLLPKESATPKVKTKELVFGSKSESGNVIPESIGADDIAKIINGSEKIKLPERKPNLDELVEEALSVDIADKDGVIRRGRLVKNEPAKLGEDSKQKPLPKVDANQVSKFLKEIAALGLDLKPEDVMSSKGTLSPHFKLDENGNIAFRDLEKYMSDDAPRYFETLAGGWAEETKQSALGNDLFEKILNPQKPMLLGNKIEEPHQSY